MRFDMTARKTHLSHPKYRPDIDGLRAVAVIAVIVFHAFPIGIKGGFIGVDIFFVISGYLISTVIFENLDAGTFGFAEFYGRRIRRIFPSLIVVLIACFAVGWFVLFEDEYKQLGKHIASGAGFISNLIFLNEAGYFDNASETKPLLHLWSLGIEEQFYIVWPLLLWLSWKRKFNILTVTIFVATCSFVLSIWGVKHDAISAFYLPQTRFWELLSGSVLAWFVLYKQNSFSNVGNKVNSWLFRIVYSKHKINDGKTLANALSLIGVFLLVLGFHRIGKELSFPGALALVPVLGTVLIISAGAESWFNRLFLSHRVLVWFGLISFPLYLWHWPLLTFARIIESELPNRNIRIAALLLSILLAWLTYKLVEQPMRSGKYNKTKVYVLAVMMGVVGYVGYYTYSRDGLSFRSFNQKYISFFSSIKVPDKTEECFEIPYAYNKRGDWFCSLGATDSPVEYFAYGDSHALSLIPALELFAIENKIKIQFAGASGCPSILGVQSIRGERSIEVYNCKELNERIFNHVKSSGIKTVILANRWTYYTNSFSRPSEFNALARDLSLPIDKSSSTKDLIWAIQNTVSLYSAIGVKVIFIEDTPQQLYEPRDVLRRGGGMEAEYLKFSVGTAEHKMNQEMINKILNDAGAKVVNLDDILCTESICPLVANSQFLYSDDDHLSVAGSLFVSKALSTRLRH